MCKFCEGNGALEARNHGEGYSADVMFFGKKGMIRWALYGTVYENTECDPETMPTDFTRYCYESESKNMAEYSANVFVPGSEEPAYYHFNYCPECGRPLENM